MFKILFTSFLTLFISTQSYATTKIMPLGDSITYDDAYRDHKELGGSGPRPASERHGYRNYLWYKLQDARFNVNFVGSRATGSAISPSFDGDNEGYPGETSSYIANHVYGFLRNNSADIILLHIGSNDGGNDADVVGDILDEIDRYESNYHHHIKVILALIIQRREARAWQSAFNNSLRSIANNRISNGDDIYVVDMEHDAGIHYDDRDFQDRTHPNNSGYNKMAGLWFSALKRFLNTAPVLPAAPSNFRATSLTDHSVLLKWTDNATNETQFKINNGDTPLVRVGANSTQAAIDNLEPDTTYTLSIRAHNDNGDSQTIRVTFKTLPPPIPPKPTELQPATIGTDSITLTWSDTSSYEKGFKIYQGSTLVKTLPKNTTSYTITGLASRETYTYKIVAYADAGNSDAASITFTTKDDYGWLPAVNYVILF